jgi:hypothetical protein
MMLRRGNRQTIDHGRLAALEACKEKVSKECEL